MPELPEVETIVRRLRSSVMGRRIVAFHSRCAKQARPNVAAVRRAVVGQTIAQLGRRGKYIVFYLEHSGFLLVHLGMSGRLGVLSNDDQSPRHVRASWELDDGNRLLLSDARKFGRIEHVADLAAATAGLGIEPLSSAFTAAWLAAELRKRSRQLKPLLLDQSLIAGLGNIYVDESLFRAGVHPLTRCDRLDRRQTAALHRAIREVLREAIRYEGTSFDWAYRGGRMQARLKVYGRAGEPCRRCRTPIAYLRVSQRGTHICPRCQPAPRSDRTEPAEQP